MIDITKKYWMSERMHPLCVKCSIVKANVVVSENIDDLKISEGAKRFFSEQVGKNGGNPTAFPDDPQSQDYLREISELGYTVFYHIDEPIGVNVTEYELDPEDYVVFDKSVPEPDLLPTSLDKERAKRIESFKKQCAILGLDCPQVVYQEKEYGTDWFYLIE